MKLKWIVAFVCVWVFISSPTARQAAAEPVNLLSLQEGALPVMVPPTYSGWNAENLLDDSSLRPESKPVPEDVRSLLTGEPSWALTIEGHTDSVGGDDQNQVLSRKRAEAVKAYLVDGGIKAERLKTAGYGESRPVAGNASELGRAQNRRVELVRE